MHDRRPNAVWRRPTTALRLERNQEQQLLLWVEPKWDAHLLSVLQEQQQLLQVSTCTGVAHALLEQTVLRAFKPTHAAFLQPHVGYATAAHAPATQHRTGSAVAAGPSSHHVGRLGTSVLTTGPLGAAATAAQSSQASSSGRSPLLPATLSRVATQPSHSPASNRADAGSSGSPSAAPAATGSNSSSRFQGLAARGSSTVNALSSPTALRGPAPTFGAQRTGALTGPTPSAASAAASSRLRAGSLVPHQDPGEGPSTTSVRAVRAHGAVPTSRVGGGYGALAPRSTAGTRMAGPSTNRSSSGSQGTGGMASPSSSTAAPSAPRPASGSISTPAPDLTSLAAGNLMFPIAAGQPPEVLAGEPPNSRQASARRPSVPSVPPHRPSGPAPSSSSPSAASTAAAVGTRFLNPYSASYATQTGQVHRPDRPGSGCDASVNSNDSDERSGAGARLGHSSRDGALAAAELGGVGLTGLMSRMRGVGASGASGAAGQLSSSSHGSGAARGLSGAPLHQQGAGAARGQGPSTQHQQQRMLLRGAAGGTSGGDAGSDVEDDSADESPVMPFGRAGGTSGGSASPGDRVTATHGLIGGAGRDGTMGGGSGGGAHARASIAATLNRLSAAAADAAAALGPGVGPSSAAAAAAAAAASAAQVRRRQGHGGLGAGSTTGGSTTSGRSSALTGHAEFGRAGSGSGASRSMAAADLDLDLDFRLNHTARGRDASRPWLTDRDRDRVVDGDEDTVGPSQARARLREGLAARDAERSMLLQALMGGPTDFLDMAEEMQMAMGEYSGTGWDGG